MTSNNNSSDGHGGSRFSVRLDMSLLDRSHGETSSHRPGSALAAAAAAAASVSGRPPPARLSSSYHTFRYQLRPDHVDYTKEGVLSKEVEGQNWTLDLPSLQPNEPHQQFSAPLAPGKEIDCILVFDPDSQSYVLARVSSSFNLIAVRRSAQSAAIGHDTISAAATGLEPANSTETGRVSPSIGAGSAGTQPAAPIGNSHSHSSSNTNTKSNMNMNIGQGVVSLGSGNGRGVGNISNSTARPESSSSSHQPVTAKPSPVVDSYEAPKFKLMRPQPYKSPTVTSHPVGLDTLITPAVVNPPSPEPVEDEYDIDMIMDQLPDSPVHDSSGDDESSIQSPIQQTTTQICAPKQEEWEELVSRPSVLHRPAPLEPHIEAPGNQPTNVLRPSHLVQYH
ncbi:hypothetical protein BASA61_000255 [Batrachochytrium salamandrivorans]|nr:hypothetical protein BASA61_000255 [Batrachochytrium salamandrivorans]